MNQTLYVSRKLINVDELYSWCKENKIENLIDRDKLHVTIAYSKKEVDHSLFKPKDYRIKVANSNRELVILGKENNCLCLKFDSVILSKRHKHFIDNGCSFDYDSYKPHLTLSYNCDKLLDKKFLKKLMKNM